MFSNIVKIVTAFKPFSLLTKTLCLCPAFGSTREKSSTYSWSLSTQVDICRNRSHQTPNPPISMCIPNMSICSRMWDPSYPARLLSGNRYVGVNLEEEALAWSWSWVVTWLTRLWRHSRATWPMGSPGLTPGHLSPAASKQQGMYLTIPTDCSSEAIKDHILADWVKKA